MGTDVKKWFPPSMGPADQLWGSAANPGAELILPAQGKEAAGAAGALAATGGWVV